jgi:signal recognition particle GTPase
MEEVKEMMEEVKKAYIEAVEDREIMRRLKMKVRNKKVKTRLANKEEEQKIIRHLQSYMGTMAGLSFYNENYPWFVTPTGFVVSKKTDTTFVLDLIEEA